MGSYNLVVNLNVQTLKMKIVISILFVLLTAEFLTAETQSTKYMVGGYFGIFEFGDLENENAVCQVVSNFPERRSDGEVGTFINEKALICGDYDGNIFNGCYSWNAETNQWDSEASMNEKRVYAAAIMLSDEQWWVTGGEVWDNDGDTTLDSTEVYDVTTKQFTPSINLPHPMKGHNIFHINDTHIGLLGPSDTLSVYIFNRATETWSVIATLPENRDLTCIAGIVEYPDGTRGIMVSGGLYHLTSIFLNLETLEWEDKAALRYDIYSVSTLPYGNSILAFGGSSHYLDIDLDTIYYYDPEADEWLLFGRMNYERTDNFPVFYVPDSYANCN